MRALISFVFLLWAVPATAAPVLAAVAANFAEPMQEIAALFERDSGHDVTLSIGSSGQLYAQIANGAPYDVFLAADQLRPARAEEAGLAVEGSQFTYAVGVLTLYSPDPDLIQGPEALDGPFRTLAIANPRIAPYGAAAHEVLTGLGHWQRLQGRIAQAQNIAGAFAAVHSGAADLGFVALSSVLSPNNDRPGSRWDPPRSSYAPLAQDAVLLARGRDNNAAGQLLAFLQTAPAHDVIRRFGYELD